MADAMFSSGPRYALTGGFLLPGTIPILLCTEEFVILSLEEHAAALGVDHVEPRYSVDWRLGPDSFLGDEEWDSRVVVAPEPLLISTADEAAWEHFMGRMCAHGNRPTKPREGRRLIRL